MFVVMLQCSISVVREAVVTLMYVALCVAIMVALVSGTVVLVFNLVITSTYFLPGVCTYFEWLI